MNSDLKVGDKVYLNHLRKPALDGRLAPSMRLGEVIWISGQGLCVSVKWQNDDITLYRNPEHDIVLATVIGKPLLTKIRGKWHISGGGCVAHEAKPLLAFNGWLDCRIRHVVNVKPPLAK